jgi:hypothetical protein
MDDDRHLVSEAELRAAIVDTIRTLAPLGSDREISFSSYATVLICLLADFLVAAQLETPEEIEQLTATFRERLEDALAKRHGAVGHA